MIAIDDFTVPASAPRVPNGPQMMLLVCEGVFENGRLVDLNIHPNFRYEAHVSLHGDVTWTHGGPG